jgi:hypothetical protein
MYVIVQHQIKDAPTAFSRGEALQKGEGAPPGARVLGFYPSQDQAAVTCIWEADSVDSVQGYVDSTLGDASENSCYGVDAEQAMGIPEPAATGA